MEYEKQKKLCDEYAQKNGGAAIDVRRISGRIGSVVVSKDDRIVYDPFIAEPIAAIKTVKEAQDEIPRPEEGKDQKTTRKPRKPSAKKK